MKKYHDYLKVRDIYAPRDAEHKELKISEAVFVGTVIGSDVGGRSGFYRFRVERSWKGACGEFITVSGGYGTCSSFSASARCTWYMP